MISKAIFYKEWIKTRKLIYLLCVTAVALIGYTFINTGYLFRINGAVDVWNLVIQKDMSIVPSALTMFLPISALLISLSQYSSEITDKRLKLTLHLPLSENVIVSSMLNYGALCITSIYIVIFLIVSIGLSLYYPFEILKIMILKNIPYVLAGYACYFLTAWSVMEPLWKQRAINAIISISVVTMFFIESSFNSFIYGLPFLFIVVLISMVKSFYSASRFKDGAQR